MTGDTWAGELGAQGIAVVLTLMTGVEGGAFSFDLGGIVVRTTD